MERKRVVIIVAVVVASLIVVLLQVSGQSLFLFLFCTEREGGEGKE